MLRPLAILAALLAAAPASAVNVVLDYTYASSFFSTATTNGQQARAAVQAAADYFTEILDDNFPRVENPSPYISTAPGQPDLLLSWNWDRRFFNPATGQDTFAPGGVVESDDYIIYVGARSLSGNALGSGGPGGYRITPQGSYYLTPENESAVNTISQDFEALVSRRSQDVGDFGGWGGSVTFNTGSTWHYDHTTLPPSSSYNDLFSVALHEIGHVVGLGVSDEWSSLVSGLTFLGNASRVANGGAYAALAPPTTPSDTPGHWASGTNSTVFGGTASQEPSLAPTILSGTRKLWTTLDAAGLTDIGWEVVEPDLGLPGDYNADGVVDAADYTVWRDNLGTPNAVGNFAEWSSNYGATAPSSSVSVPEPTTLTVLLTAIACGLTRRRR